MVVTEVNFLFMTMSAVSMKLFPIYDEHHIFIYETIPNLLIWKFKLDWGHIDEIGQKLNENSIRDGKKFAAKNS